MSKHIIFNKSQTSIFFNKTQYGNNCINKKYSSPFKYLLTPITTANYFCKKKINLTMIL